MSARLSRPHTHTDLPNTFVAVTTKTMVFKMEESLQEMPLGLEYNTQCLSPLTNRRTHFLRPSLSCAPSSKKNTVKFVPRLSMESRSLSHLLKQLVVEASVSNNELVTADGLTTYSFHARNLSMCLFQGFAVCWASLTRSSLPVLAWKKLSQLVHSNIS